MIHAFEEECHVDMIERRAKNALWTLPLDERQDLVIVRDAGNGLELFRRAIGVGRRGTAGQR